MSEGGSEGARGGGTGAGGGEGQTAHYGWQYLGVGCVTAVAGLFGGGMIAVLVAKIVGGVRGCRADADTGAPCDWTTYWAWGARIGLIALPTVAIWLLRRSQKRSKNFERG
jgi:hypothetical protein